MRAKNINTAHIEGRVYQHSLALKTVQNQQSANFGKQFINGTIEIAVDEAGMEVIPVEYVYVTETTSKGGQNKTYAALLNIIQNGKTVMADGMEAATKVSIDTATDLNDFVAQDGSMVSQQIFNGGFVEIVGNLKPEGQRTSFKTDMVITNISHIDADAEKMIDADYTTVRGVIFNFRNAILPVEFVVKNPLGMGYFESLEVSNAAPLFTTVWGNLNFVPKAVQRVEESAFGEAAVTTFKRKVKEWVITGANKLPHDFGDESVMTMDDLVKASQAREVYLADVKKKREEYMAQKNAAAPSAFGATAAPTPMAAVTPGAFKF